ncbi:hypothetical protein DVH24_017866 [Malus domestica]|uniref:Uncharacterized protein n=1 Tax=Malus domestica TaxID=3750 RepID=A0A498KHE2_MALDO|nr:hypothetical protein DVH24_017866 [Malus domestica]
MGLLTWSASMDFKGVLSISMGDRLWIFGTEFAQIFEPGKSLLRIYQRSGLWTFVFSMALLTDTLGLVDGEDFSDTDQCEELKQIVRHYRNLSETQLITIKDLLRFMLTVKSSIPAQKKSLMATAAFSSSTAKPATRAALQIKHPMKEKSVSYRKFTTVITHMDSRWPKRRLEFAAEVNPTTRILEYTVHDLADGVKVSEPEKEIVPQSLSSAALVPGVDVSNDALYLYEHVLLGYPESELVELAT